MWRKRFLPGICSAGTDCNIAAKNAQEIGTRVSSLNTGLKIKRRTFLQGLRQNMNVDQQGVSTERPSSRWACLLSRPVGKNIRQTNQGPSAVSGAGSLCIGINGWV